MVTGDSSCKDLITVTVCRHYTYFNLFTCHSNVYYSIVHLVENNCGKNILYVHITFGYHRYKGSLR